MGVCCGINFSGSLNIVLLESRYGLHPGFHLQKMGSLVNCTLIGSCRVRGTAGGKHSSIKECRGKLGEEYEGSVGALGHLLSQTFIF